MSHSLLGMHRPNAAAGDGKHGPDRTGSGLVLIVGHTGYAACLHCTAPDVLYLRGLQDSGIDGAG